IAAGGPPPVLRAALAVPLPIAVICELLGVPYEDRARFRAWTQAVGDIADRARSEQGLADLFGYGQQLVARKRLEPGDDVISRLCATEGVGDDEAAMLAMFLLFAGHETTVVAIGMGALLLLDNPAQWEALKAEPGLIPGAVEEMLRAPGAGGGGIPRYAHTDLDIDGVTVRAGELVLLDNGAANHDAAAFAGPHRSRAPPPARPPPPPRPGPPLLHRRPLGPDRAAGRVPPPPPPLPGHAPGRASGGAAVQYPPADWRPGPAPSDLVSTA